MTEVCIRFVSDLCLAELQHRLGLVERNFRDAYLTTPCARAADSRLRIDVEASTRFRMTAWSSTEAAAVAETALAIVQPRESRALSVGRHAGSECAAWLFESLVPFVEMQSAFGNGEISGDHLRATSFDAQRMEDVRWSVTERSGNLSLEVTYDANPHDESRWREICERSAGLLKAWSAQGVVEPTSWSIGVETRRGHAAWSYDTQQDLMIQQQALAAVTGDEWQVRDNDRYGDYLHRAVSGPYAEMLRTRVYEEAGRFVLDLRWTSERSGASFASAKEWVEDKLLPAVGARHVRDDEGWD